MKVANAIVRRILVDTESSVDIIIWDCLKKLTYPGREIIPLVHPILGFEGQEGDQRMAREYNLVSVRPLVKRMIRRETQPIGKKAWTGPPSPAAEALVIHTVTSAEPERPRPEAVDGSSSRSLPSAAPAASSSSSGIIALPSKGMCRRIKLHQLRILTLGLGTPAILDELDVCLKISFNAKGLRCQSHQDFPKELGALPRSLDLADLSALTSTLERASSSWCCKSFFSTSKASFSFFNFSKWRLEKINSIKQCGLSFTSAIATCSSSTGVGFAESTGASDHDLANFSTKVCLAEASAAKMSTHRTCVCTKGSPMACSEEPRTLAHLRTPR
ncbi:hypothetical protein Cgig2_014905 [Carnegiea gigantea]|uniref:Uncharacterized protein n=1 Tax=Carnegiea gigantea TaxID=171969 RepID=A0A9Q1GGU2_9CARY|nr:hypothetical protein Cgig2_014905 [Carnegiea gigantea]